MKGNMDKFSEELRELERKHGVSLFVAEDPMYIVLDSEISMSDYEYKVEWDEHADSFYLLESPRPATKSSHDNKVASMNLDPALWDYLNIEGEEYLYNKRSKNIYGKRNLFNYEYLACAKGRDVQDVIAEIETHYAEKMG